MSASGTPITEVASPILQVRDLTIEFAGPHGPMRAVDGVSFDLRRGETLGLVGESGCGKTTTVLGLMRLLPPGGKIVGGSVWFDGVDLVGLDGPAPASVPLDAPLAGLPGSHERAQPGAHGGGPDRRGIPSPLPGDVQEPGRRSARASSSSASGSRPAARASTRTPTPAACDSAR